MKPESLKEVLVRRDGITNLEAEQLIEEARADLYRMIETEEFIDDADFCIDWFGLEPDYILELL